jgi:hypothetical protein
MRNLTFFTFVLSMFSPCVLCLAQHTDTLSMSAFAGHYLQKSPEPSQSHRSIQFAIPEPDSATPAASVQPWLTFFLFDEDLSGECLLTNVVITHDSIRFSTAESEHYRFEFAGRWLPKRDSSTVSESDAVIEGDLTYFAFGKFVRKERISFFYLEGC